MGEEFLRPLLDEAVLPEPLAGYGFGGLALDFDGVVQVEQSFRVELLRDRGTGRDLRSP